ncbi:MAG: hypothetical protein O3B31_08015 [Chloroflexi bacterium]|nr:hypothetical protein [Chloroflexota bacterium]
MQDTTTLQTQTIDVSVLAAQSGAKTLNFDQLGVSFTMTGSTQTGLALASALNNKETRVVTTTDYSVKLTNVGTGANQTLLVNEVGESADVARLDFSALGVPLTFSGRCCGYHRRVRRQPRRADDADAGDVPLSVELW